MISAFFVKIRFEQEAGSLGRTEKTKNNVRKTLLLTLCPLYCNVLSPPLLCSSAEFVKIFLVTQREGISYYFPIGCENHNDYQNCSEFSDVTLIWAPIRVGSSYHQKRRHDNQNISVTWEILNMLLDKYVLSNFQLIILSHELEILICWCWCCAAWLGCLLN